MDFASYNLKIFVCLFKISYYLECTLIILSVVLKDEILNYEVLKFSSINHLKYIYLISYLDFIYFQIVFFHYIKVLNSYFLFEVKLLLLFLLILEFFLDHHIHSIPHRQLQLCLIHQNQVDHHQVCFSKLN